MLGITAKGCGKNIETNPGGISMGRKVTGYKLTGDLLEAVVHLAIDKYRQEQEDDAKVRYDKRRASTKLLLRNYRSLKDHCENAVYDADTYDEGGGYTLSDILEMVNSSYAANLKINTIRESSVRTKIIIDHIDTMLDVYASRCERSSKKEDSRRYRVIYGLYLSKESRTRAELASEEYVDKSTIHRDVEEAVESLTALIFGIDGLDKWSK